MDEHIVKDRYLELDGTPSEAGPWKKYISPWTLTSAFVGAMMASCLTKDTTEFEPLVICSIAAAGVATKSYARHRILKELSKETQKYVIDTAPKVQKNFCTPEEMEHILRVTKFNAKIGFGMSALTSGYLLSSGSLFNAAAMAIPLVPAPIAYSCEGYHLAGKLEQNKWTVIPRGQMDKETTKSFGFAHS